MNIGQYIEAAHEALGEYSDYADSHVFSTSYDEATTTITLVATPALTKEEAEYVWCYLYNKMPLGVAIEVK